MKKLLSLSIALILMLFAGGCEKTPEVEHLHMSRDDVTLPVGKSVVLSVAVYPSAAAEGAYKDLEWSSTNGCATITKTERNRATIYAKFPGTATITVTYGHLTADCGIYVEE